MSDSDPNTPNTKDLTKIGEFTLDPSHDTASHGDENSAGSLTSPPPTETIDEFASLEDLSQSQPVDHGGAGSFAPHPEPAAGELPPTDFSTASDASSSPEPEQGLGLGDPLAAPDHAVPAGASPDLPFDAPPADPAAVLEEVKQFAQNVSAAKLAVPAAYPFSLKITGPLRPEEKERLLDLLARENMGIRDTDLEPQFESGRILIPRVSEYAGVLLVQALRGTQARMELGPADEIFAGSEAGEDGDAHGTLSEQQAVTTVSLRDHPAERLPMTMDSSLPDFPRYSVVDVVSASASLRVQVVEAEHSEEYQRVVEALQRELRYKAYHRGALGILNYSVTLSSLQLPSHYRVMVSGTAIKPAL